MTIEVSEWSEVPQFAQMMDDGSSMMDHDNDDVCVDDSDVGFDDAV